MPASATSPWINSAALACLMLATLFVLTHDMGAVTAAMVCLAAWALPVILLELAVLRVHRRASTGLDWSQPAPLDVRRVLVKLAGLLGTVGLVVLAHALLRIYPLDDMRVALTAAKMLVLPFLLLAVPYVVLVDRAMREPHDGNWHAGNFFLGRWRLVDFALLREHALGWVIKGFFLPIMLVYLVRVLFRLDAYSGMLDEGWVMQVRWLTDYVIALELTIVCVGYALTLRALDAHIRSPNPYLSGWLVTLVCYAPFNAVVIDQVLAYEDGRYWFNWFGDNALLAGLWGVLLLFSFGAWLWATMSYGIRWSNLTHRGIITHGPYRYTKHPDYVSKSLFFWLVSVPFLAEAGPLEALANSLLLFAVNLIYWGRAVTEERHLSQDPDYVAYALAMNERSVFRPLARLLPFLRYRAPGAA